MSDTVAPNKRSWIMRQVKSKDTSPERLVRSLLHGMGYRFRLHRRDLPGSPDIVFPGRKKVIFVHGCFWHGHSCPRGSRLPKTNTEYWRRKIARNKERDRVRIEELRNLGWRVLVVWECETKDVDALRTRLEGFLGPPRLRREQARGGRDPQIPG